MNKAKNIEKLVEQYADAATRARRIFLISNITAILLLTAYFNLHWTWLRRIPFGLRPDNYLVLVPPSPSTSESALSSAEIAERSRKIDDPDAVDMRREFALTWTRDFQYADFRLVGAKIFVDDIPLLGGAALAVIMTWYYFARRRERGIIKEISQLAHKERDPEIVRYIFYGVSFSLIFNTVSVVDDTDESWGRRFARLLVLGLFYAPCAVMALIILHDFYQTAAVPIEEGDTLLVFLLAHGQFEQLTEISVRLSLSGCFLFYSFFQASQVRLLSEEDRHFRKTIDRQFERLCQEPTGAEQVNELEPTSTEPKHAGGAGSDQRLSADGPTAIDEDLKLPEGRP